MKKLILIFVVLIFCLAGKVGAANLSVIDKGWVASQNLGQFSEWAKPFCKIFSFKNRSFWFSSFLPNTDTRILYSKCTQKVLVTPTPTPNPTPTQTPRPTVTVTPTPTPTQAATVAYTMPVLVLKYFPLDPNDPSKLNRNIVGGDLGDNLSLVNIRQKITNLNLLVSDALERGSTYHGYKEVSAKPLLDYQIIEEKEFLRPILRTDNPGWDFQPDHLKELRDLNICDYVDNRGVKEVWLWMYHNAPSKDVNRYYVAPVESNMSSPYGDWSNSYRYPDDLPICQKTYILYEYNYGRGFGEAVEDHTHHMEAVYSGVDYSMWNNKFVGTCGSQSIYRCGWTHYPPNVRQFCTGHDYDWANQASVLSDCEDWKSDGSGAKKQISCHTWAGAVCDDNSGDKFKVWWMQNIPTNWWIWTYDFDRAKREGRGLN